MFVTPSLALCGVGNEERFVQEARLCGVALATCAKLRRWHVRFVARTDEHAPISFADSYLQNATNREVQLVYGYSTAGSPHRHQHQGFPLGPLECANRKYDLVCAESPAGRSFRDALGQSIRDCNILCVFGYSTYLDEHLSDCASRRKPIVMFGHPPKPVEKRLSKVRRDDHCSLRGFQSWKEFLLEMEHHDRMFRSIHAD